MSNPSIAAPASSARRASGLSGRAAGNHQSLWADAGQRGHRFRGGQLGRDRACRRQRGRQVDADANPVRDHGADAGTHSDSTAPNNPSSPMTPRLRKRAASAWCIKNCPSARLSPWRRISSLKPLSAQAYDPIGAPRIGKPQGLRWTLSFPATVSPSMRELTIFRLPRGRWSRSHGRPLPRGAPDRAR